MLFGCIKIHKKFMTDKAMEEKRGKTRFFNVNESSLKYSYVYIVSRYNVYIFNEMYNATHILYTYLQRNH